jgi:hypothetical protein
MKNTLVPIFVGYARDLQAAEKEIERLKVALLRAGEIVESARDTIGGEPPSS